MKVLHICKVYLPTKGGVQVVVNWLSDGLKSKGWASTIFSTFTRGSGKTESDIAGVNNSRSYGELFSLPLAPGIISKIWKHSNNFDIVCVHYPFPLADIAMALLPRKNFSLVVYWHSEIVSQKLSALLLRPLTIRLLKRADAIACSSPSLITHSKLLSKFQSKCTIIPFGMPSTNQAPTTIKPSAANYFLFIGRHVPYKGIDCLLQGFADSFADQKSSNYTLKIVGSGPLLLRHQKLAASLNISDKVDFLIDVSDAELDALLASCRCLVLPSVLKSEAFGLVQIEAMSNGRPIINTSLDSGVPWVARNNREAITVKPNNVEQLSSALTKISTNHDFTDELGGNALKRFSEVFEYSTFCENTDSLYRSLLKNQHQ